DGSVKIHGVSTADDSLCVEDENGRVAPDAVALCDRSLAEGAVVPAWPRHSLARHHLARGVFIRLAIDTQKGEWSAFQAFNEFASLGDLRHAGATPRPPEDQNHDLSFVVT